MQSKALVQPASLAVSIEAAEPAQYRPALYRFVRGRVASADDAQDVTQEALARLYAFGRARVEEPLKFLIRTAANLLIDRKRSAEARTVTLELGDEEPVADLPSAERIVSGREQVRLLEAALEELPPNCRTALVLFRFDGLSHAEIAEQLSVSVSMVEKYVRQALRHCRQRLAQANGGGSP